jgi:hypothetical protein
VHKGHIHEPNFTGRPGFKVGLGGRFAYDGWDLFAEYTWLAGGSHSNCFHAKHGEGARTALNVVDGYGSINTRALKSGCADWDQNFNEIDLMLGRNFFISRHLTLRPSVGFKGAYIQEKLDMHFKMTPDAATMLSAKQHRHQNMWGIGTRFGLDGVWHFKTNWGVYGNIYATALWSHFDTTAKDIVVDIPPGGAPYVTSTNLYTTGSIREVIPVLETSIGFTYLRWFHHNKRQFQIQLGWEEQIFIHFNHFMDLTRDGNLSLHGLTLRLGVML